MKKFISIILDIVVVLLIGWFILGYINFSKISEDQEPVYVVKEYVYEDSKGGIVHVYDNIIYKIISYKSDKVIYALKLWFMEDI